MVTHREGTLTPPFTLPPDECSLAFKGELRLKEQCRGCFKQLEIKEHFKEFKWTNPLLLMFKVRINFRNKLKQNRNSLIMLFFPFIRHVPFPHQSSNLSLKSYCLLAPVCSKCTALLTSTHDPNYFPPLYM